MTPSNPTAASDAPGGLARLVDEQLELAATRLPALAPEVVHPSPLDHEERPSPHPDGEAVLLGQAAATPEMAEELAALEAAAAAPLSDEELERQALADGGGDGDAATPE
jgi:hypothetical protein